MGDRAAKVRRLSSVGVPHTKLAEIVARLSSDRSLLEETVSRQALGRSVAALWDDVGQLQSVATSDGGSFHWAYVSLPKLLSHLSQASSSFRSVLLDLWHRRPCHLEAPYNLVVYADEVALGRGS